MALDLPIQGSGFVLREFVAADAQGLADIEFDPEVKRYLAIPERIKEDWVQAFDPRAVAGWAIVVDEGVLAGRASLMRAKRKGDAELVIVIAKPFWGRELGRRVASLLVRIAFEEFEAKALIGIVHPEHKPSIELLRSLKFRHRRVLYEAPEPWQTGHYVYRLTRRAYKTSIEPTHSG